MMTRSNPTIYDLYNEIEKDNHQQQQQISPAEAETIRRVLSSLQALENKRLREGLNERNFSIGVLNTLLITYVFGSHPEHFWLLFLIKASLLVPLNVWHDYKAKPLCRVLYYLDFCWITNVVGVVSLYAVFFLGDAIPGKARIQLMMATVGVGCGSLLGATAILPFLATVFHDHRTMTSLFTHIVPPMLLYTLLWHGDAIREAWPGVFRVELDKLKFFPEQEDNIGYGPFFLPWKGIGSISGNAAMLYLVWWVLYSVWMLTIGLELTRTKIIQDRDNTNNNQISAPKYDTVYFSMVRDGYSRSVGRLWGRRHEVSERITTLGEYEYRDFLLYMTIHAVLVFIATNVLAYACLASKLIHATFIWIVVVLCVFRGAKRYVYWITNSSSKALQKEYREALENSHVKIS